MYSSIIRTRMAPSPTGYPHIGSIYNALFNKVWAIKNEGKFVWRSEDTDRERFVDSAEKSMKDALEWFNLIPDEGPFWGGPFSPYRQSERLEIYKKYANELLNNGHAYYCFCSKERLEQVRQKAIDAKQTPMYDRHCLNLSKKEIDEKLESKTPFVIRMKIPKTNDGGKKIICKDLVRGDIEFDPDTIDDQVLLKSDGFPTYHLAVVVDDHLMEITHIIRGHGWLPSFPKQVLLYKMFKWDSPIFAHFPDVLNMDTKGKLSKRHGHSNVAWYRSKGFLPEAILNFVALLGWSHPEGKEIFDFDEFVRVFDIKDISSNLPKFDLVKLEWLNGEYIRKLDSDQFLAKINAWLEFNIDQFSSKKFNITEGPEQKKALYVYYNILQDFLSSLPYQKALLWVDINKTRIKKFEDLIELNYFFNADKFKKEDIYDLLIKYKSASEVKDHLSWFHDILKNSTENDWSLDQLKKIELEVKDQAGKLGWKVLEVFYPIRIAVTGCEVSPPLFESIYILGRQKTINRIAEAVEFLS